MGTKNLWTLKRCGYSKDLSTSFVFCGYSKFVGSKIEGIQICGYSNFVAIKHELKLENRTWVLSKNKKMLQFFI